jgi:uncharacterized protein YaiI (UPF0178 family)
MMRSGCHTSFMGESPDMAQEVVKKAVLVLNPGGRIMIHEFILNTNMDGPLFPALFSINMYLGTEGGRSYSEDQLRNMLKHSGIINIERHPFEGPTQSGILMGMKA